MQMILDLAGKLAMFIGTAGSLYCLAQAFAVHRLMRLKGVRTTAVVVAESGTKLLMLPARSYAENNMPAVTIFKPLRNATPSLREDLETLVWQDYAGPVEIIFGLHSDSDPAKPLVDQFMEQHPFANIKVIVNPREHGANAKITNLLNMHPHARNPIFVVCDGDTAVRPNWLSTLIRTLEAPGIGLASCLYGGVPERPQFWSIMSAMGVTYSFLPNAVFAAASGLETPCLGAAIAIRRTTLAAVGGFERFASALADDYDLGMAVRAAGYGVALSTSLVYHNAGEKRISEFFAHELRWARTIRMINPIGYALSAITYNVGFAALGVLAGRTELWLAALAFAIGARTALQRVVERSFACRSGPAWLLPLRDLLSFLVFVLSFMSRKVRWGGRVFDTSTSWRTASFQPPLPQDPRSADAANARYP